MAKLYELADVLRSKNSGPFEITLDVFFKDENVYQAVKKSGAINKDKIQEIYQLDKSLINDIVYFDAAQGIKITYARTISSGTCFDRDVYGAQQHAPLMELDIDL